MERPLVFGISVALFAALLVAMSAGYQAWLYRRQARRSKAARRLGIETEALRARLDLPVRHGSALWLQHHLDQAGDVRTLRVFIIQSCILGVLGCLASVILLHGPAKVLGLVLGLLPLLMLRRQSQIRSQRITEQLPDAFDRIAGTLRAGHAFSDALRIASEELPAPLSDELARVVLVQSLGVDLRRSLQTLAVRNVDNFDIRLFVSAVLLNRETGGNLVEILSHLAETVRERLIFDGKVVALTAEVRLSAWILGSLPFVVSGALLLIKPTYLTPLLGSDPGRVLLAIGAISLVIGAIIMRRLAAVEV
jgi:tight adherence protein B